MSISSVSDSIDLPDHDKNRVVKSFIESHDSENIRRMLSLLYEGVNINDILISMYEFACITKRDSDIHNNLMNGFASLSHSEVLIHAININTSLISKNMSKSIDDYEDVMLKGKYIQSPEYVDILVDKMTRYIKLSNHDPYDMVKEVIDLYGKSSENVYAALANKYHDKDIASSLYSFSKYVYHRACKDKMTNEDRKNISSIEKYNQAVSDYTRKFNCNPASILLIKEVIPIRMISNSLNSMEKLVSLLVDAYMLEKYNVSEALYKLDIIAITRVLTTVLTSLNHDALLHLQSLSDCVGKILYGNYVVYDNGKYYTYIKNMPMEMYYKRFATFKSFADYPYDMIATRLGESIATRLLSLVNQNRIMYSNMFDIEQMNNEAAVVDIIILCIEENVYNVMNIFVQKLDVNCSINNNVILCKNFFNISFITPSEIDSSCIKKHVWMQCSYDNYSVKVTPSYMTYLLTGVSFESSPYNIGSHISRNKAFAIPNYFRPLLQKYVEQIGDYKANYIDIS